MDSSRLSPGVEGLGSSVQGLQFRVSSTLHDRLYYSGDLANISSDNPSYGIFPKRGVCVESPLQKGSPSVGRVDAGDYPKP